MKKFFDIFGNTKGFTLAEVVASLTIGALVLVAVLAVYGRALRSSSAISQNLDSQRFGGEVLQRIAEDLDGAVDWGREVKITIRNKVESHGFRTAQLEITKTIYDDGMKPQVFEKIIWQANYDYDGTSQSLVLYRSHSGIAYEDKLLEAQKENFERELFVPVCSGITYFSVQVPMGGQFRDSWTSETLPAGVTINISFAEPFKAVTGGLEVSDLDKIVRTVAVDRTRKLKFVYAPPKYGDQNQPQDSNNLKQEPNEPNKPPTPTPMPKPR